MIDKKSEKVVKTEVKSRDDGVELENQFILRLPEEPGKLLREAIQTGNLKERMTIKMDNDLRYGEVTLDQWLLHAKIVDLPTIVECLKTIDNKSFYKSSDICQLMICKEEAEALDSEKESPNKGKKKDPNKVDKKFLWPHGITPPSKNVRKRRFRKTLKKKNVDAPEIEKEVKRLLRIDNDAVKVDFEIINEEIDKPVLDQNSKEFNDADLDLNEDTMHEVDKAMNDSSSHKDINVEYEAGEDEDATVGAVATGGVGEHDIFGGEVSSSDDEFGVDNNNTMGLQDMEDTSRLSADDTRMSTYSTSNTNAGTNPTNKSKDSHNEFNKSMFGQVDNEESLMKFDGSSSNLIGSTYYDEQKHEELGDDDSNDTPNFNVEQIKMKLAEAKHLYNELKNQQAQKAQEISTIQNPTLKQRLQDTFDNLLKQIIDKEMEIKKYENILNLDNV